MYVCLFSHSAATSAHDLAMVFLFGTDRAFSNVASASRVSPVFALFPASLRDSLHNIPRSFTSRQRGRVNSGGPIVTVGNRELFVYLCFLRFLSIIS